MQNDQHILRDTPKVSLGVSRRTGKTLTMSTRPRHQTHRRKGPARRDPQRVRTNVRLELALVADLEVQAERVDLRLMTYLEVVLAQALGYAGKYLPEVAVLPTPLSGDALRTRTRGLGASDCVPVRQDNHLQGVKVEEPLLEIIRARAVDLDVQYTAYMRAILREAAGHTLPGYGEQPALDDLSLPSRGGVQLRKVS